MLLLFWAICLYLPLLEARLPIPEILVRYPHWMLERNYMQSAYLDRFLRVDCTLLANATCPQKTLFEIYDEETQTVLTNSSCDFKTLEWRSQVTSTSLVLFTNDTRIFGKLRCRLRGDHGETTVSDNFITIPFLICPDSSDACIKNECDNDYTDRKYCIFTKVGQSMPCSKITDRTWCRFDDKDSLYCPVNQRGLCNAVVQNSSAIWFKARYSDRVCPNVREPPITYKGKPLFYDEPFFPTPNEPIVLNIKCPRDSPFFNEMVLFFTTWNIYEEKTKSKCVDSMNLTLTLKRIESSYALEHKLFLFIRNYEFKTKMVIMDTSLNITINDRTNKLECAFTGLVFYNYFQLTTWWTKKSAHEKHLDKQFFMRNHSEKTWGIASSDLTAGTIDEYQCHVLFVYKTCSPHRRFNWTFNSSQIEYNRANTLRGYNLLLANMLAAFVTRVCFAF